MMLVFWHGIKGLKAVEKNRQLTGKERLMRLTQVMHMEL